MAELKTTTEGNRLFENTARKVTQLLGGSERAAAFLRQLQDEETFNRIDNHLANQISYRLFPPGTPNAGQADLAKMDNTSKQLHKLRGVLSSLRSLSIESNLIEKITALNEPMPENYEPDSYKKAQREITGETHVRDLMVSDLSVMQSLATLYVMFELKDNTKNLTDKKVRESLGEAFGYIVDFDQDTWVPMIYDKLSLELAKEYRDMLKALLPNPDGPPNNGIRGNDYSNFMQVTGFGSTALNLLIRGLLTAGKPIETIISEMEKNADGDIKFYESLELANQSAKAFQQLDEVTNFSAANVESSLAALQNTTTAPNVWALAMLPVNSEVAQLGTNNLMSREVIPRTELQYAIFPNPIFQYQVDSLSQFLKNEVDSAIKQLIKDPQADITLHGHALLNGLQHNAAEKDSVLKSEFDSLIDTFAREAATIANGYSPTGKQAFKKAHLENLIAECNKIKNDDSDLSNKIYRINNLFNTVVNQHKKDCKENGQGLGATGVLLNHTRGIFMDHSRKLNIQNDAGFHKLTQQVIAKNFPELYNEGTYEVNMEQLRALARQTGEARLREKTAEAAAKAARDEQQSNNQSSTPVEPPTPIPAEPTPPTPVVSAPPAPELEQAPIEPSTLPKFNKDNVAELTKRFIDLTVIAKRLQNITENFGTQYQAYNNTYEAYSSLTGWGSYFIGGTQAQHAASDELESLKQSNDKNANKFTKYTSEIEEQLHLLNPLASTDEEKALVGQIKAQLQSLKDLEAARRTAMDTLIANQEKKEGPQVAFKAQNLEPDPVQSYLATKNELLAYSQEQHDREIAEQEQAAAAALAASILEATQDAPETVEPLSPEDEYRQYIEHIAYLESSKSPADRHMHQDQLMSLPFYSTSNKNAFIYADIIKRDLSKLPDSKLKITLSEIKAKSGLHKAIDHIDNAIIDAKKYDNQQPRKFFSWLLGRKPYDFTALENALKTPFTNESVSVFSSFLSNDNVNRLKNNKSWNIQDFQAISNISKHINSINNHLESVTTSLQSADATLSHRTNDVRPRALTPQRAAMPSSTRLSSQTTSNVSDELREEIRNNTGTSKRGP